MAIGSDKAEGRKEIMEELGCSWRTIIRHRANDPGFRRLFRKNPSNGKPYILRSEYRAFLDEFNKLLIQA